MIFEMFLTWTLCIAMAGNTGINSAMENSYS